MEHIVQISQIPGTMYAVFCALSGWLLFFKGRYNEKMKEMLDELEKYQGFKSAFSFLLSFVRSVLHSTFLMILVPHWVQSTPGAGDLARAMANISAFLLWGFLVYREIRIVVLVCQNNAEAFLIPGGRNVFLASQVLATYIAVFLLRTYL